MISKSSLLRSCVAGAIALGVFSIAPAMSEDEIIVGLITKTEGNPFFVKMREGAQAKAKELGIDAPDLCRQVRRRQRRPGGGGGEA